MVVELPGWYVTTYFVTVPVYQSSPGAVNVADVPPVHDGLRITPGGRVSAP